MSRTPRLLLSDCPARALAAVAAAGDAAAALLVPGGADFTVATMTMFGPHARAYPAGPRGSNLVAVARQTLCRESDGVWHTSLLALWCPCGEDRGRVADVAAGLGFETTHEGDADPSDLATALEAFLARRPGDGASDGRTRSWTMAPLPETPFRCGDPLRASLVPHGRRWVVRWTGPAGADGGIHVVIDRSPTGDERAIVESARARVVSQVYGVRPDAEGEREVIQTLVLDIPSDLARAFPDGRLPRHGVLAGGAAR